MGVKGRLKEYKKIIKGFALKKESVDNPILYGSLLKERAVFITGGTSGIGLSIAEACVRNGASVVITGRNVERINSAIETIRQGVECTKIEGIELDNAVADVNQLDKALAKAEELLGTPIDALVNNAGVIAGGSIPNTSMDGFSQTLDTNLKGAYFLSQCFAKKLVAAKIPGNILNVCSSSSLRPAISPYTISKWGLRGMTLGFAKALIPYGIVVNGIAPGPTATPMLKQSGDNNLINDVVPAGRYATPEEIANMAVVLMSDLSRMIVGDVVYMTGGCGNLTFEDMNYSLKF